VNTVSIEALHRQASFDFGQVVEISRGELNWKFGLPEDGRLLAGGALPYTIEWQCDSHPAELMADRGCSLRTLKIKHPRANWLRGMLSRIDATELVTVADAEVFSLSAKIFTPKGIVCL